MVLVLESHHKVTSARSVGNPLVDEVRVSMIATVCGQ